jgi:hypothetical protein
MERKIDEWVTRPGTRRIIDMPSKIVSLEKVDGQVFAVLEGGQTINVSQLAEPPAERH